MNQLFLLIVSCFIANLSYSQTSITGKISDDKKNAISFTNVLLKNFKNNIISYTFSNEGGSYELKTDDKGNFNLVISAMGFEKKIILVEIPENEKNIVLDVVLKEMPFELNEVIVNATKPIIIKNDTIVFNVKSFFKGNEQVVEDLLKNIPGIQVSAEGTIKVGNQEVEKVMIDGDDFFEKGYKILTKNMPINPVEQVEILQKYSNNKLLKGVEQSDKVALNLKLKADAKRQWFGNLNLGYGVGTKKPYEAQSNLMSFGKKNKYYFLSNFNNVGDDVTGEINQLIRPFRFDEISSVGDNQSTYSLMDLSSFTPNFKASRTNFNNAELVSLNAIFTLSNKVKMKTLGFFNWDENDFFRNSIETYYINETTFTNTEDYKLRKKRFTGFGKVDVTYDISKTKMLEISSKYNNQEENSKSDLVFNEAETNERLINRNELFDQKIIFTNKFEPTKALIFTGRYIYEKSPQNYNINKFFYQDLFPNTNTVNNVGQMIENELQFAGFEAHLLDRKDNGNLLELKFGNQYRKDNLLSILFLKENNSVIETPTDYQNNTIYSTNDLYFNSKYRLKIDNLALTGKLETHQLFNQLEFETITKQQPFFVNPSIGFDWEINQKNKVQSSYSYNTTNATILDVYSNYILTEFSSFSKGTGAFNQLNASSILLNYQLGNWSDKFFANTLIIYNKNHDFFSTNSFITQNYSLAEKIVIKDREMLNMSANIDWYFKAMSSNLKLDLGYSKYNYKNIVNNSDLREVTSNNYNYGIELRSGFKGVFNYHIGTKWTTNEIKTTIVNSFTDNVTFLDLIFVFNNKLNFKIQTERYYFGSVNQGNNIYNFLDLDARYVIKENRLTFSLSGKNLFNTETFKSYAISDINVSTTAYRLLPRQVLLKMEYRF
ncbi:MAG: carboxypeptidase-like regulatory domain-containing protein [Lutibacter sp.]|nr:carboxypeptidase-like regulatory domain-containing protein [Lutibacter sp.]